MTNSLPNSMFLPIRNPEWSDPQAILRELKAAIAGNATDDTIRHSLVHPSEDCDIELRITIKCASTPSQDPGNFLSIFDFKGLTSTLYEFGFLQTHQQLRDLRISIDTKSTEAGINILASPIYRISTRSLARIIRDPVHGDIGLTPWEVSIIDTPQFQKLRGIKQLGFTDLIYPGATHTRFNHSLGVLWLAKHIMNSIEEETGFYFSQSDRDLVSAIALLHDVTHIPFGHTIEDEHQIFKRHDEPYRMNRILSSKELDKVLDKRHGEVKHVLSNIKHPERLVRPYIAEIIGDTISADLLDYLRRDSIQTGLVQDYDDRIFRYFAIRDGHLILRLARNGVRRLDAVSGVLHLLSMRYSLTEKVYYHHGKVAFGSVLAKAISIAQKQGRLKEADLYDLTDYDLLSLLASSKMPATARRLAERIQKRERYRRAYALPLSSFGTGKQKWMDHVVKFRQQGGAEQLEQLILEKVGVDPSDIAIYCPPYDMQLKEADVRAEDEKGQVRNLNTWERLPEVDYIAKRYQELWTFYVFGYCERPTLKKIHDICAEHFEMDSDYELDYRDDEPMSFTRLDGSIL